MRATLWIAASGFLFASASAYAGTERPMDNRAPVDASASSDAPVAPLDVTITHPDSQSSAREASKAQPLAPEPRSDAAARSHAVTFDPDHPGGEFPSSGG